MMPTQTVYQNIFLLRNQAAIPQDSWLVSESSWLKHTSVSAEAKAHGLTNNYDATKVVLQGSRARKGGTFFCHRSVDVAFMEPNNY